MTLTLLLFLAQSEAIRWETSSASSARSPADFGSERGQPLYKKA